VFIQTTIKLVLLMAFEYRFWPSESPTQSRLTNYNTKFQVPLHYSQITKRLENLRKTYRNRDSSVMESNIRYKKHITNACSFDLEASINQLLIDI
jgi:hypothetical protein